MQGGKRQLYEHDIRVPCLIRGPHVEKNKVVMNAVLNIDLAPTIYEIISQYTKPLRCMDGMSFLPLIDKRRKFDAWRKDFLISYRGDMGGDPNTGLFPKGSTINHMSDAVNNTYHCVRTMHSASYDVRNTVYCEFVDDEKFVEFYNLTTDRWQLHNTANKLSKKIKAKLKGRLNYLKKCQGISCRKGVVAISPSKSLSCPATTPTGKPHRMNDMINYCMHQIFKKQKCKCKQKICIDIVIRKRCGRTVVSKGQEHSFRKAVNKRVNIHCGRTSSSGGTGDTGGIGLHRRHLNDKPSTPSDLRRRLQSIKQQPKKPTFAILRKPPLWGSNIMRQPRNFMKRIFPVVVLLPVAAAVLNVMGSLLLDLNSR